jgi:NADP-dependent 3-hydroxy acid dehydrogenase YdfG
MGQRPREEDDSNVIASIQLARAVVPHFRTQGGGKILQLSSLGGQAAFPGMSLYHPRDAHRDFIAEQ